MIAVSVLSATFLRSLIGRPLRMLLDQGDVLLLVGVVVLARAGSSRRVRR